MLDWTLDSKNNGSSDDDDIVGGGGVRHHMPLEVGDVTLHNGWTLHCADAAEDYLAGEDRYALSITFVVGRAEVQEDVLRTFIVIVNLCGSGQG